MDNKIILGSLALDLKRVALGLYRGSNTMAERFIIEAIRRKNEITNNNLPPYINMILNKMEVSLKSNKSREKAEDALMYSTLIQNYVLCRL